MRQVLAKAVLVLLPVVLPAATSPVALAQPAPVVHHDLAVTLDPPNHRL